MLATFDAGVEAARGDVAKASRRRSRQPVLPVDAEGSYLRMLGSKVEAGPKRDLSERTHRAVLGALEATARDGAPPPGPRGGKRWLPRYFVRRVAWHVLDHAWEIEDRAR